jgi:hypothetical protein
MSKLVCRCSAYPFPHRPAHGLCHEPVGSPLVSPRGAGRRKPKPPGRPRKNPPPTIKRKGWLLYGAPPGGAGAGEE